MSKVTYFYNDNGKHYLVLEQAETPTDYNDHLTIALLKEMQSGEYVVAVNLGKTCWGHGHYFFDISDAVEDYNETVAKYSKACV